MSHLIELDHIQTTLLTDLMDRADQAGQIPAGKGMAWAAIRQQLAQPQETATVVARIKAQALQEAQQNTPAVPVFEGPQSPTA